MLLLGLGGDGVGLVVRFLLDVRGMDLYLLADLMGLVVLGLVLPLGGSGVVGTVMWWWLCTDLGGLGVVLVALKFRLRVACY